MASEMNTSPEYTGYRLEVFIAVFTPLTIIAVALRFYARSLTSKKIDSGDWLIIAALVGQIVAGGIAIGKFWGVNRMTGTALLTDAQVQ